MEEEVSSFPWREFAPGSPITQHWRLSRGLAICLRLTYTLNKSVCHRAMVCSHRGLACTTWNILLHLTHLIPVPQKRWNFSFQITLRSNNMLPKADKSLKQLLFKWLCCKVHYLTLGMMLVCIVNSMIVQSNFRDKLTLVCSTSTNLSSRALGSLFLLQSSLS